MVRQIIHKSIYKLVSSMTNNVYIGFTRDSLAKTLNGHKYAMRKHARGHFRYCSSFELVRHLDCQIILIENYCKEDIRERRRYWRNQLQSYSQMPEKTFQKLSKKERKQKQVCECGALYFTCRKTEHELCPQHQAYTKIMGLKN